MVPFLSLFLLLSPPPPPTLINVRNNSTRTYEYKINFVKCISHFFHIPFYRRSMEKKEEPKKKMRNEVNDIFYLLLLHIHLP